MAFWATVVVVCLPLMYVLGFGPWCWFVVNQSKAGYEATKPSLYRPVIWAWHKGSEPIRSAIAGYANLASGTALYCGVDFDGTLLIVSEAP